jgi:hypothetical protein
MNWWRVLYVDSAGEGRYAEIQAASQEKAAWMVAMRLETTIAVLVAVMAIDEKEISL